jgi:hypothetical protein
MKTMIDLDSVDEFHASLPRVETRASEAADLRGETAGSPSRWLARGSDQYCIKRTRSPQQAARLPKLRKLGTHLSGGILYSHAKWDRETLAAGSAKKSALPHARQTDGCREGRRIAA